MYALVLIRYRAPLDVVQAHTDDHRAYLRTLKEAGTLLASGPFDPRTGGGFIVRVPDDSVQASLDAIRDNDPFWQRGVANYELLPWAPVIGREALDAIT
jgi:uncharacterized protein YciI